MYTLPQGHAISSAWSQYEFLTGPKWFRILLPNKLIVDYVKERPLQDDKNQ